MLLGETKRAGKRQPKEQTPARDSASSGKAPRTARGERTLRIILEAAREEFGERGFSDA